MKNQEFLLLLIPQIRTRYSHCHQLVWFGDQFYADLLTSKSHFNQLGLLPGKCCKACYLCSIVWFSVDHYNLTVPLLKCLTWRCNANLLSVYILDSLFNSFLWHLPTPTKTWNHEIIIISHFLALENIPSFLQYICFHFVLISRPISVIWKIHWQPASGEIDHFILY